MSSANAPAVLNDDGSSEGSRSLSLMGGVPADGGRAARLVAPRIDYLQHWLYNLVPREVIGDLTSGGAALLGGNLSKSPYGRE